MVDEQGNPVISRLNSSALKTLAKETNGRYTNASSGTNIPAMVQSVLNDLEAFEIEGKQRKTYLELYQWALLPAIVLLFTAFFFATRWKKSLLTLSLALLSLTSPPAQADSVSSAKQLLSEHKFEEAASAYEQLANEALLPSRKAQFYLGQGNAALLSQHFPEARSAFSKALLSKSHSTSQLAYFGLANSLFQIGWKSLDEKPYPSTPPTDFNHFDSIVKSNLGKLTDKTASSAELEPFRSVITNWTDAIRHFHSAKDHPNATENAKLALTYLERLQKLLEEDAQNSEQQNKDQNQKPPQDKKNESDKSKDNPQNKENPNQKNPEENPQSNPNQKSESNPPNQPNEQPNPPQNQPSKEPNQPKESPNDNQPNESPEQRARRILKENSDLEKGPTQPGRREFFKPSKDW
jgi:hypothetical protein